jgi:hypothetical protein
MEERVRHRRVRFALLTSVATAVFLGGEANAHLAAAGTQSGLLVVSIVDPIGEPVPGAKVEVRRVGAAEPPQSDESNRCGLTRFLLRRNATYDITVSLSGFVTEKRGQVTLHAERPTVLGVALSLPDPCAPGEKICM